MYNNSLKTKTVYLAGGIAGLSYIEAYTWRNKFKNMLPVYLDVRSPLRDMQDYSNVECFSKNPNENGDPLGNSRGIFSRDFNDVIISDVVVANLLNAKDVSIGTCCEIAWCYCQPKRVPTVIIMEEDNIHSHGFIYEQASFLVKDLSEAASVVRSILNV